MAMRFGRRAAAAGTRPGQKVMVDRTDPARGLDHLGRTLRDVTDQRARNTDYFNDTGVIIGVRIRKKWSAAQRTVEIVITNPDGEEFTTWSTSSNSSDNAMADFVLVPPGFRYKTTVQASIYQWIELRP